MKSNGSTGNSRVQELQQSNESLLKDKLNVDLQLKLKNSEEAIYRLKIELNEKEKQLELSHMRVQEE